MPAPRNRATRIVTLLLALHLVFCAARIVHAGLFKRAGEIARWRELGAADYQLTAGGMQGADVLRFVAANSPNDAIVLYRGDEKGALEFAPALLWPRLVYRSALVPGEETPIAPRPLARGELPDGRRGIWVLVGERKAIRIEVRR